MVCTFNKITSQLPQKKIRMIFINTNEPENNSSLGDSRPSHFTLIFNAEYTHKNAVSSHKPSSCIPIPVTPTSHQFFSIVHFPSTPLSYHSVFCYDSFWPGFCLLMEYITGVGRSMALLSANTTCTQVNMVL